MTKAAATRATARVGLILATMGVVLGLFAPLADAHRDDQSYVFLDVGEQLEARVQMPYTDVREVLGVDIRGDAARAEAIIAANEDVFVDYVLAHLELRGDDGAWALTPAGVGSFARHVEVSFDIDHPADFKNFDVTFDPFFDEIEDRDALLIIANDLRRGVIDSEEDGLVRFTPSSRDASVDLGDSQQWRNFWQSIQVGMDHIRTGPDHVLFILALVLPSVLIYREGWKPQPEFRSSLWRVIKMLTMFTIAHSVTFSLAGLGLLPQPNARLVESMIAISIVATAFHNLKPIWQDREWIIAFVFGLFHGLGFASLITGLDVSTSTQLVSLLGRNLGIEIGQVFVVLLVFPMLFALRVVNVYRPLMYAFSLILAVIGSIWALERITERETSFTELVDAWMEYPRVLIYIALASALAFGYRLWVQQKRPDQLVAPGQPSPA